ncbi:MAG: PEP-CTERM sorting domain-containing protein, partial [Planctomycetota bacterium]|nr:PEP-CTERM sorting domain-containing protein [Planctomycetota bacterium]
LALGQTHLIVGQWVIGAGNDSLSVWADPADLQHIGAPLFTQSDADAGAALYLAGVFAYGSSSSGTSRQGKLDALRISDGGGDLPTAYQDVTGVSPEPATLALVLAGLAALARKKVPDTRISR